MSQTFPTGALFANRRNQKPIFPIFLPSSVWIIRLVSTTETLGGEQRQTQAQSCFSFPTGVCSLQGSRSSDLQRPASEVPTAVSVPRSRAVRLPPELCWSVDRVLSAVSCQSTRFFCLSWWGRLYYGTALCMLPSFWTASHRVQRDIIASLAGMLDCVCCLCFYIKLLILTPTLNPYYLSEYEKIWKVT